MNHYKLHEIFYSIQGEGPQIGMPAIFIRLSGCNLNCDFCDSKYANTGTLNSQEDIINDVCNTPEYHNCPNVIITGGEPLIQDILPLIKELITNDKKVYVETNGTIYNQSYIGHATFIVSPKLKKNTKIFSTTYLSNLYKWSQQATFKFVIDTQEDFSNAINLVENLTPKQFYFMPQCITREEHYHKLLDLIDEVKEVYPKAWVSPRLQIYLYDTQRGV